ncbi:NAD-glutamate dehydrogenase [Vibrio lentus]|nr:NAD-glutamate dehydrogenase [Vibrio lentus]
MNCFKLGKLLEVGTGVVQMDRESSALVRSQDPFGRFFSCMVYVTKRSFTTPSFVNEANAS